MELEMRDARGRRKKAKFAYTKANAVPSGPAFFPSVNGTRDVQKGKTEDGWGYIHIRRCPGDLPDQIDKALAVIGDSPGMILDFRGNSGGGFDHPALMGRFVPKGKRLEFAKGYESAGDAPYGGPIVVIIDATVRSAGETAAAIFKEDGRAYVIGESPTAGMSASKTTIELPSGLFSLYVAVRSTCKGQTMAGVWRGLAWCPHETVEFDPVHLLTDGVDTLIKVAEQRLKRFRKIKCPTIRKRSAFAQGSRFRLAP